MFHRSLEKMGQSHRVAVSLLIATCLFVVAISVDAILFQPQHEAISADTPLFGHQLEKGLKQLGLAAPALHNDSLPPKGEQVAFPFGPNLASYAISSSCFASGCPGSACIKGTCFQVAPPSPAPDPAEEPNKSQDPSKAKEPTEATTPSEGKGSESGSDEESSDNTPISEEAHSLSAAETKVVCSSVRSSGVWLASSELTPTDDGGAWITWIADGKHSGGYKLFRSNSHPSADPVELLSQGDIALGSVARFFDDHQPQDAASEYVLELSDQSGRWNQYRISNSGP